MRRSPSIVPGGEPSVYLVIDNLGRLSGARSLAPEDDRPTIDKPPRGELWDDQNDTIM
jgi:hypothetical protein